MMLGQQINISACLFIFFHTVTITVSQHVQPRLSKINAQFIFYLIFCNGMLAWNTFIYFIYFFLVMLGKIDVKH